MSYWQFGAIRMDPSEGSTSELHRHFSIMTRGSSNWQIRARLGAAVLILVTLVIAGWAYLDWSRYRAANAEAARNRQILDSTQKLLSQILDAETGQRGFLLTGEDRYLDPYLRATTTIDPELSRLALLVGRDSAEAATVEQLKRLVDQKMSELGQTIEVRRTQGAKAAIEIVLSDRGRSLMDRIRELILAIQSGERGAVTLASADAEAATMTVLLVAVAASLILLFFFLAALDPLLYSGSRESKHHPRLMSYAVALASVAMAVVLRMPLAPTIGPVAAPFLTFLPAVLFAAWYAGVRAGATTVLLLATVSAYFTFGPYELSRAERQSSAIGLLFFIIVGSGIVFLVHSQRRAIERADREAVQRRAAEEAEREQRREFETTLASIGDAVVSTDAEGRIRFVNDVARSILGYTDAELLCRPLDEVFRIVNEHTREPVESPVAEVLREGTIVGMANHTILIAGDGAEIPLDDSGAPVRGSDGKIKGVVLVFRDVTERRAAEKLLEEKAIKLRESEGLFRSLVNALPQMAWMTRDDGWVCWYNDRWYEYTGGSAAEMEGWGWQSVHDSKMLPEILERWRMCVAGGTPFEMVFPLRGKDGVYRPFLTRVIPMRDSEGEIVRWLGTNTDITAERLVERDLRESEARLERLNADLARSNADLEQFAFVASHDLQEPLRMITSYAQLLARKYPAQTDEEAEMLVSNIVNGAARMRNLLTDLLQYAEIGASDERKDQTADLNEVIDHVKQNLKDAIEASGAVIECGVLPTLEADGTYLIPLFQNLASNAIKYRNSEAPRMRVSAEIAAGELRFAVSDNGIGIDPEYHRKIFDVFQRLHGRDVPGTGLGLAICKRVVERYRGRIWVESQKGSGSTFFFTLPEARVCERRNPEVDSAVNS
jgi:PAS domain S-box-containing protein